MTRIPARLKNYYFVRDRGENDLPWVRVRDLRDIELPRPIVVVNGAFDLLHSGHMKVIFAARERAGTLICAMDSDTRIARKSPNRPILTFPERAVAMQYMPVDYLVEIGSDADFKRLMETLRPDLRVQGQDYQHVPSKYPHIPKAFVRGTGMRTSKIVERCKK